LSTGELTVLMGPPSGIPPCPLCGRPNLRGGRACLSCELAVALTIPEAALRPGACLHVRVAGRLGPGGPPDGPALAPGAVPFPER
jgi:hypothetical protein